MIALITGKLIEKEPDLVIIDVGGVGYELTIPLSTWYEIAEPGSEVTLRVQTHVREDALQLFGFRTEREKRLFLSLTSVTGIGPKLAITILSGMSTDDLVKSLHGGDVARLVGIPGVGRKTAERMLVELKDKMKPLLGTAATATPAPAVATESSDSVLDDTISALFNLGYPRQVAEKAAGGAVREMPGGRFPEILRLALRKLARQA